MAPRILTGAIIGYGQVAHAAHTPAFMRRGWQIAAVADPSEARLESAQASWPGVRRYTSAEELLRNESSLDFVDIATPPVMHPAHAMASLEKGFHVLCEKPLALSSADFGRIMDLASRKRRVAFTIHNWLHAPIISKFIENVRSGALGQLSHVEIHVLRERPASQATPGSWRTSKDLSGGGILVDHGWHALSILRRILNERPKVLACRLSPDAEAAEEEATVFLRSGSATALIYLTWRSSFRANRVVAYGTGGSAELLDDELLVSRAGHIARTPFPEKLSKGSAHPEWFYSMLEDFESSLASPRAARRNLEEAAFCIGTIGLAYRSRSTPALEGDHGPVVEPLPAGKADSPSQEAGAAEDEDDLSYGSPS